MSAAPRAPHLERVVGPADRLVGRDRHIDAGAGQPAAELGELLDGAAGLLDVLQVEAAQLADRLLRLVDRPGAVGVDPDPAVRAESVPYRLDPGQIAGQAPAGLGDLDLGRPAAGRRGPARTPDPGPRAGIVLLTSISVRTGGGQPSSAASSAARNQGTSSGPA